MKLKWCETEDVLVLDPKDVYKPPLRVKAVFRKPVPVQREATVLHLVPRKAVVRLRKPIVVEFPVPLEHLKDHLRYVVILRDPAGGFRSRVLHGYFLKSSWEDLKLEREVFDAHPDEKQQRIRNASDAALRRNFFMRVLLPDGFCILVQTLPGWYSDTPTDELDSRMGWTGFVCT